jgi:hypothetical protein
LEDAMDDCDSSNNAAAVGTRRMRCLTRLGSNPVSDAKLGVDSTVDA